MVARKLTPLSDEKRVEVLRAGHVAALGREPSENRLAIGWAQTQLETRGALWNHNIGNIKARPSCCNDPASPNCMLLEVPEANKCFRAYPNHVAGAASYWSLLDRRYSSALERFDAGDVAGAAHELKEKGYYGAPEQKYSSAMKKLYDEYNRRFRGGALTSSRGARAAAGVTVLAAGGAAVWWTQRDRRRRENPSPLGVAGAAAAAVVGVAAVAASRRKKTKGAPSKQRGPILKIARPMPADAPFVVEALNELSSRIEAPDKSELWARLNPQLQQSLHAKFGNGARSKLRNSWQYAQWRQVEIELGATAGPPGYAPIELGRKELAARLPAMIQRSKLWLSGQAPWPSELASDTAKGLLFGGVDPHEGGAGLRMLNLKNKLLVAR